MRRTWVALATTSWLAFAAPRAHGQDEKIFRYQDRDGRQVYTNLEGSADSSSAGLSAVSLPPLSSIDFAQTGEDQLQQLDHSVRLAHESLQNGERCDRIRADSRISLRAELWERHRRELTVAAALLCFALLLVAVWRRRELRALMPLAPLLGACYVGYVAVVRTKANQETLREGLRACTSELPDGSNRKSSDVRSRLSSALEVQDTINRVYEERARRADRIMQMR